MDLLLKALYQISWSIKYCKLLYIIGDYLWGNSDTVCKTDNTLFVDWSCSVHFASPHFFLTKNDKEMGYTMQSEIWLTDNY